MADNQDRKIVTRRSGGFFYDISNRAKLIGRLMMDSRVNPFIKVLPVGTLVYLLFPDIPGPVDDALVIWLGTYLFVELCPPDVVREHTQALEGIVPADWNNQGRRDDVVEGQYYDQTPMQDTQPKDPSKRP